MSAAITPDPAMRAPTIERLLEMRCLLDVAVSPDGSKVAFPVGDDFVRPGEARQSRIWEAKIGEGEPHQLTHGPGSELMPRWSPDGRTLAFASDRDRPGVHALYVLGPDAAEPRPVGEINGSIEDIRWSSDGKRLTVLAADPGSDRAGVQTGTKIERADDSGGDPTVTRPRRAWRRLHSVDLASERTVQVSPDGVNVWEFDWDGEAMAVAVVSDDPSESAWYSGRLAMLNLGDHTAEIIYTPEWQLQCPRLSPSGQEVACIEGLCSDRGILVGTVMLLASGPAPPRSLAPHLDVGWIQWLDNERLWYCGRRGLGSTVGLLRQDGRVAEAWFGEALIGERHRPRISPSADGRVVTAVLESPDRAPEIVVLDTERREEGMQAVTRLNSELAQVGASRTDRIAWRASDGLEIEGLLLRPGDHTHEPLPLIVIVHGGPTAAWTYHFTAVGRPSSFAAAGYAVLLPNPRGSAGRGQQFARANLGDVGGRDLQDILDGVDALIERGIADRGRVGITGVSYGGFMSAWAITQTDRFAAAVPIACVSNWLSFHLTTNIARFDELFLDGNPYESGFVYLDRSPVMHARGVATPTLILHGELDLCAPVGQAQELYQAFVEAGVDTELVVYPREGHGFREYDHQIDLFNRSRTWFDDHLRGVDCGR